MHDRRRIRALSESGLGPTAIARLVGCSRASVHRALAPDAAMTYRRRPIYGDAIGRVEQTLAAWPLMPATALARQADWPGSLRQLQDLVLKRRSAAVREARERGVTVRPLPPTTWPTGR